MKYKMIYIVDIDIRDKRIETARKNAKCMFMEVKCHCRNAQKGHHYITFFCIVSYNLYFYNSNFLEYLIISQNML